MDGCLLKRRRKTWLPRGTFADGSPQRGLKAIAGSTTHRSHTTSHTTQHTALLYSSPLLPSWRIMGFINRNPMVVVGIPSVAVVLCGAQGCSHLVCSLLLVGGVCVVFVCVARCSVRSRSLLRCCSSTAHAATWCTACSAIDGRSIVWCCSIAANAATPGRCSPSLRPSTRPGRLSTTGCCWLLCCACSCYGRLSSGALSSPAAARSLRATACSTTTP
jgi:hypothetical protein